MHDLDYLLTRFNRFKDRLTDSFFLNRFDKVTRDFVVYIRFKQSLANLNKATSEAQDVFKEFKALAGDLQKTTGELRLRVRDAAQAVITNSEQISKLLQNLNKAAEQLNSDQGTAGKILYDSKLYEEMLASTENLNQAVEMLRNLLNKWSQEGLKLKW